MAHDKAARKQTGRSRRKGRTGPRAAGDRPATDTTLRRTLRREVAGTVGVLTDAYDFDAMRGYRTFPFEDHREYLRQVDGLLKTLASRQLHTTVALFDPEDFAEYCSEHGLDPDTPTSRSSYTAAITTRGSTVPYTGQPLDSLLPELIDKAVRQSTWEYATLLLADLGACADCGQDVGRSAFDRASRLLMRLLEGAGEEDTTSCAASPPPTNSFSPSCTRKATRPRERGPPNWTPPRAPSSSPSSPPPSPWRAQGPGAAHQHTRRTRPPPRLAAARGPPPPADRGRGVQRVLHGRGHR